MDGPKEKWKATVRKLKSQTAPGAPKPSVRHNTRRHPTDVGDGCFCDAIFDLLHARGGLRSHSDLPHGSGQMSSVERQARPWSNVPRTDRASPVSTEQLEATCEENEEMSLPNPIMSGPGSEPIASVAYRLVSNYLKRLKRRSKRSSPQSSIVPQMPICEDIAPAESTSERT